jgi:GTPase
VVDISHPQFEDHIAIVQNTLAEIGSADKPTIIVFNKIDAYTWVPKEEDDLTPATVENLSLEDLKKSWMQQMNDDQVLFVSAEKKQNIEELRQVLYEKVKTIHMERYPYNDLLY